MYLIELHMGSDFQQWNQKDGITGNLYRGDSSLMVTSGHVSWRRFKWGRPKKSI